MRHRAVVIGTRHMVAAGHYLAAHAGFQILEAGGNAVDAGVAAGLVLEVVHSEQVNVAGVAPIILYLADRREVLTISGVGTWPQAISLDRLIREYKGAIPDGLLRTVVPAAPDAWITALARFGTMSFGEVARAAVRFARDGFPMHAFMADMIRERVDKFARWPANAAIYLPKGRPPEPGELFVQADLAETLQYMVDEEAAALKSGREAGLRAARDAFYRGDIAATIVRFHRENGGLLTAEDMAGFSVGIEPPERTTFGDVEVHACGAWSQGPMLLQALNVLDGIDLGWMGHNSPAYIHTVTEALKLAFADRHRYYGDPRVVKVPLETLLSPGYAARRREMIRPDRAWPEMPPPGEIPGFPSRPLEVRGAAGAVAAPPLDTSYVSVVDRHGNAFSSSPSDVAWDTPVIPGLGICPSSRGSQGWTDPDHPGCIAPGKRPRLTPNPALALRDGRLLMPFGTPGGDVQPQAMLQVFLNIVVFGMKPQEAVDAPRFVSFSFPDSFEPHAYEPGRLRVEGRIPTSTTDALAALGHGVERWPDWFWKPGGVCCILVEPGTGLLHGAADVRRPACAVGW